jgi:hypothetical protein
VSTQSNVASRHQVGNDVVSSISFFLSFFLCFSQKRPTVVFGEIQNKSKLNALFRVRLLSLLRLPVMMGWYILFQLK